jgi:hypothetical protein
MTPGSQLSESSALRNLRRSSEERGFKFYMKPSRELVPAFLEGYTPDAIAIGPDGRGIIIELKRHRGQVADRSLADIAKRVADQKGWEFRAIYTPQALDEPAYIGKPTPEQVEARLKELQALVEAGHYAPALMTGWAVMEALARLASADSSTGRFETFSPVQAVQTLAEEGYLEHEAAESLGKMAKLRNEVAHGDLSVDVPAEQVELLLQQLRTIASDIGEVTSRQHVG